MITRIGFSTRTLNSQIRPINAQFFRQPKEWSRMQRLGDSVWNIIDGYKPVVVKGIDKSTGKKVALRDDKGRKLINWVRNIEKDNFVITDTLNFNGTKIVTAKDINSGQIVAKEVAKSNWQGSDFFKSSFENGKVKAIRQFTNKITNRKLESMSEIFWIRRNSDGKLNKKVFEDVLNCPVQQEVKKFLAENCPELSLFNK
jgi:hypothetical protein